MWVFSFLIMFAVWFKLLIFVSSCLSTSKQSVNTIKEDKKPEQEQPYQYTLTVNRKYSIPNSYILHSEGTNVFIECQTDYKSFYIEWVQKRDTQIILETVANKNYKSSINIILSRFDNGTTFQCLLYKPIIHKFLGSASASIEVKYEKSQHFYENTIATAKNTINYYDSKELLCTGISKRWIKLSKEGLVEKILTKEAQMDVDMKLPLDLNESENNSSYMCLSLNYSMDFEKKCYNFRREIRLVNLVTSASEKRTDVLIGKTPVIAGAAGGVAVFLLVIVLICRCIRRNEPRRPAPHEVETYACPNTVQYLDLQTMSSNARSVTRDDTPYARIVGFLEPNGKRS